MDFIKEIGAYLAGIKQVIDKLDKQQINTVINRLLEVHQRGGFVYIFGNGGSASTASHFVNDFNKGVSENLMKRFKFICLNDSVSTIMAVANDISYNNIFKFQLENYLDSRDLVIGISGSGNSENVVEAIKYANSKGVETIAIVGFKGGRLKNMVSHYIHIPVEDMQQVEDLHMVMDHLMMKILKEYLQGGEPK